MDLNKTYRVVSQNGARDAKLGDILAASPRTLLYFYPKDNTPGCTLEAQDFTRAKAAFAKSGIAIVGVSLDDEKSHAKFVDSCGLGIDLISDDKTLHDELGVIGEKKNYGKVYVGVIRSTFLVDSKGAVVKEWRNVKATGHAAKVARELGIEA
ncbi:MAG: peroxiredoxin [Patescibacteria group bacterium]